MKKFIKINFLILSSILVLFFPQAIYAQSALSNCVVTKIGSPGSLPKLPSNCNAPQNTTTNGSAWPFPTQDPTQYKRVDEGWDLEFNQPTSVLAVAPGTVSIAGYDPSGFGVDYPLLTLDSGNQICGFSQIYYGHVHVVQTVLGKHVNTGDVIANTDPSGVNSPSNWLEIGFWENGPVGKSYINSSNGESVQTPPGYQMQNWLLGKGCGTNSAL